MSPNQDRKRSARRPSPFFDVRPGEGRVALLGLAALLLLIITAHTVLETARDALLLTGPGPRALGLVYMAIAACTLPAAAVAARAGARFGPRRALAGTLALASTAAVVLFLAPASRAMAIVVYVVSGVIASVVVPQFWTLVGTVLTVAQGRRLFGLIAAAGVLGGVVGSGMAAWMILVVSAKGLLLLAAGVFAIAGATIVGPQATDPPRRSRVATSPITSELFRSFVNNPFLIRVALIVFLSTATLLTVDYFFKSTVARSLPTAEIGPFVARYYLALNVLSLLVQVFVGSALVRVLGIAAAVVVTPLFLFLGASWALLSGGALGVVLLLKGIDGGLRYSIHRITGELLYLPVPSEVRERVKPLIDGALGRAAQTITGGALLALGGTQALSPRPFALCVATLAFAWLITAMTMRGSYLDLLRHAISSGSLDAQDNPDPIDLETAELLIQHLASEDPLEVIGAMNALSRRRREGLVPALILLHRDESVLVAALQVFAAANRGDWIRLARGLLDHRNESVRMAAARALAMHDALDPAELANDADARVHGYAALQLALRESTDDVLGRPDIAALLLRPGEAGETGRLGLLTAIADAPPTGRLMPLLLALSDFPNGAAERTQLFARAAARQGAHRLIPRLVSLLSARAGREAVRAALVALGEPAFDAAVDALSDATRERGLRAHIPKTLARFGTKRAAECLLRNIETERDGLVRYKSIRALGLAVAGRRLVVDRSRAETLSRVDLAEHFRILGLRVALDLPASEGGGLRSAADRLLGGLLDDKLRQSLERAFRLLKIAYPREDIHGAYVACLSGDARARANAGEFLDTILTRRSQQAIGALLRLVADDLPPVERASRGAALLDSRPARSREDALLMLVADEDLMVAALAGIVALEVDSPSLRAAVDVARHRRPEVDASAGQLLDNFAPAEATAHA